ncbi:polymeric immunoglobulin receptor-like isoform X5 [Tachysurus fulvidraco]|uniref:polymeric immunoglobulin receptor-like isoform X4 n=1 Tax=Tachysurus fulvidraco TaxID=1234273 RepID=UPI001FEDC35E|nr:polymeric immunoglobulin receptor-like isoform X4 [Tachysurus fulvidraco]XP_047669178.1 polymeric immunoglobulin receptor-like isoform X5 [Tachysurus fulvidraco]
MKILLIFTLCLISDGGASREVTGYSGGGILIKCKYGRKVTQKPKYFCKGSMSVCSEQIKTGEKKQWVNSGRFSLFDDTKSLEFRVMIRELTVQDTGTYHCGVYITPGNDIKTSVQLKVKEDLSYGGSISKTAHAGEDLTVSCKYPQSLTSHPKFVCRRLQTAACSYNTSVKESTKYVKTGKISLYDDREKQIFGVSIRDVIEQDSGEYWCGAEVPWRSDQGYKVYFTRIDLIVSASPPAGFPASTVITVSVILLLLLIGIIILILTLQNRHKMQAGAASVGRHSDQDSGNKKRVCLALCDYEEMKYAESLIYTTVIFYSNATSSNEAATIINDEVLCDYTSVTYTVVCG